MIFNAYFRFPDGDGWEQFEHLGSCESNMAARQVIGQDRARNNRRDLKICVTKLSHRDLYDSIIPKDLAPEEFYIIEESELIKAT